MIITKLASELNDDDFKDYETILTSSIQNSVSTGIYDDLNKALSRSMDDLKYFYRDDKSKMIKYYQDDKLTGLVSIRELDDNVIFITECQSSNPLKRMEITKILLDPTAFL